MMFVDTNYFLRFLLADQEEQHETAVMLFKKGASGEVDLFTSLIVYFEVYWVLASFYKTKKDELVEKLEGLLSLTFIDYPEHEVLLGTLRVFKAVNYETLFASGCWTTKNNPSRRVFDGTHFVTHLETRNGRTVFYATTNDRRACR